MPRATHFSSISRRQGMVELQEEVTHERTGFTNQFNRSGAAHARNGGTTIPYPRPQNIWIACDTADPRHSFENLYMKDYVLAIKRVSRQKLRFLVWGREYGQHLLERGFAPMVLDDGADMASCMAYTAAMGTMLVDEVVNVQDRVTKVNNDLQGQIDTLKDLCEMQRIQINDLGGQLVDLRIDLLNADFRLGGLRHWQDEMMRTRVTRGSSPIDLTGEDTDDEVVEIPGFPDHHLLEEWEEVPAPVAGQQHARRTGWSIGSLRMPLASQDEEFRDSQAEVDEQRREPYQNADQLADSLVHRHMVLPEYVSPPDYDGSLEYDFPPLYYVDKF